MIRGSKPFICDVGYLLQFSVSKYRQDTTNLRIYITYTSEKKSQKLVHIQVQPIDFLLFKKNTDF